LSERRVAVTGIGIITSIGKDRQSTWEGMKQGLNGAVPIQAFDTTGFRTTFAAEVRDFEPETVMDPKDVRKADRYCQFAIVAADEAVRHAGLGELADPYRCGVIIASGIGGMITFEEQHSRLVEKGARGVSPMFIPMMIADMASGLVSIRYGMRGPNYCTTSACASSGHAIAAACDQIRLGAADVMLAGGSEAAVTPMAMAGFGNMRALSSRNDDPATASRPFDAERDGFVLGEGGAVLVLEAEEHAKARGVEILGYIAGYGQSADAFHMTQPDNDGNGAQACMRAAMTCAGIAPEQVGYINAHGTSTPFNDKIESLAIRKVFGAHADALKISSTKSMVGHLLGAAGAVEAGVTVMAMREGLLPPTMNLHNPDPECDLFYCPNEVVPADVEYALSNSFGFGGHNVCICIGAAK
jgi:3-oxoacyl-[acyl-carrier-protein] synthase II